MHKVLMPFLLWAMLTGCNSGQSAHSSSASGKDHATLTNSTRGYDLNEPVKRWALPPTLKEISGNTWLDKDHLLVIEDLHPNLYLIDLSKNASIEKVIPFEADKDKKFDIEDVTHVGDTVYALWSHGVIFRITNWNTHPNTVTFDTPLDKSNNTEGICYDPVGHQLLIACKNESGQDEKKSTRAIYAFDIKKGQLNENPFLLIQKKEFKKTEGEKLDFYPSAVAVHPINQHIYVLSTRGTKCLAEFTRDGDLVGFQFIERSEMLQPEGLCFAPDGTMYVSTEGKHGVPPMLYEFPFKG